MGWARQVLGVIRASAYSARSASTGSLKTHIAALGSKDYPAKLNSTASEGVILFLPSESILSASLKRDPALLDYAMTRGVFLCTPSTLLVVLSTVAHLCTHARIAENADQLRVLAVELYDRVATLLEPVAKMGRGLAATLESYNTMVACLDTRVTATARKLKALGASSAKALVTANRGRDEQFSRAQADMVTRGQWPHELELEHLSPAPTP